MLDLKDTDVMIPQRNRPATSSGAGGAVPAAAAAILAPALLLLCGALVHAAPQAADPEGEILARRLYREAVAASAERPGRATERFEELAARFPQTVWGERAARWLGDNRILRIEPLIENGPRSNRIDVAVMGDGFQFTSTDMRQFERLTEDLLDHFFRSEVLEEYADCFNFYMVMLASHDDRVDYRDHRYDTALDGRKLDDDRHIVVDRGQVLHYLEACEWSDELAFAIVREGGWGTGGGGVATVGKDMGTVVIHEWGHAFAGLADEYSRDPSPPGTPLRGPNVSESPDPRQAPWAHWHERYPTKFKTHEGAAGVYKGVWRPTPDGCVMRSAHDFCAVCREAIVLAIYKYMRPVDRMTPDGAMLQAVAGGDKVSIEVVPIVPRSHRLEVEWSVVPQGHPDFNERYPDRWTGEMPGDRIKGDYDTAGGRPRHFVEIQSLYTRRQIGIGTFRIFARAGDPAVVKRQRWVLRDEAGLLTQMPSWTVTVQPPPPAPPPAVDVDLTVVPLVGVGGLRGFDCAAAVHNRPETAARFKARSGLGYGARLCPPEAASARDAQGGGIDAGTDGAGGFIVPDAPEHFVLNWQTAVEGGARPAAGGGDGGGAPAPCLVIDSGELLLAPSGVRTGRINLIFSLPPGWGVVLPWADAGDGAFRVPSVESLTRNPVCIGAWNQRESLTRHVLLRTAVAPRLEASGTAVNALFNKILTSAAAMTPFLPGRTILVVADAAPEPAEPAPPGEEGRGRKANFRVVHGEDALIFLFPAGFDPAQPGAEAEFDLLELAAYELMAFSGRGQADQSAAGFFDAAYRFLALRAAAATETREDEWFRARAARYLGRLVQGGTDEREAAAFAAGFFLDQTLARLGGEDKRLAAFLAVLGPGPGSGGPSGAEGGGAIGSGGAAPLALAEVLKRLSEFAGFDVAPFWDQLARRPGGSDVMAELKKCGLTLATNRDGVTIEDEKR